jgi:hypothetical protein
VNITLLTTIVCATRPNLRPDQEPLESNGDDMKNPRDETIPRRESRRLARRLGGCCGKLPTTNRRC